MGNKVQWEAEKRRSTYKDREERSDCGFFFLERRTAMNCQEKCCVSLCKVEFIQPSNWLYSVPNLLVIQHLVTLYLGGFDVRVVSEIE